jgi:SAM-dependent methyltransferase
MKEYFDSNAKAYHLTERKRYVVLPALKRNLKKAHRGAALLDLACGNALFYSLVTRKGYAYFGLDISPVLLKQAQEYFPQGAYQLGNATSFSKLYKRQKFDVILSNLLLPALNKKQDIVKVLVECAKTLKSTGELVLVIVHPAFDMYMHAGALGRKDIHTQYKGYFASGTKYTFTKQFPTGPFRFTDYHWTLSDYFDAIQKAGFKISKIDECPPGKSLQKHKPQLYKKYQDVPGYMVLVCNLQA